MAAPETTTRPDRKSVMVTALSDTLFYSAMAIIGGAYAVLILLLLVGDIAYMLRSHPEGAGTI